MLNLYRSKRSGFSLIYILIIIVVVVIIAVVAAPRLLRQQEKGKRTTAVNDIDAIGLALDIYASHNGTYPSTEQGLKSLWEKPIIAPIPNKWQGPYLDKPILKDPWGNDYIYIYPGKHNKHDYDLISYGKDGAYGGKGDNEDITNWTEEE
ncbi:TPA: type II secretion system protein GspG [Candidatus Poribacteria bacterium]|nr:type II secretion system protein GspG [Candidatus Poribacteria bacterium]